MPQGSLISSTQYFHLLCSIFSNIGIHPPSQTAEVKMLKKMWASHWCCHTLRPFELWAGICSERKRLMTSQHQIINWIPTNIFLSSQLCLEGSRYIKILRLSISFGMIQWIHACARTVKNFLFNPFYVLFKSK